MSRTLRVDEAVSYKYVVRGASLRLSVAYTLQAQIISKDGRSRFVEGPRSIFVWPSEEFRMLYRYTADQNQYIVIKKRDGTVEHIPG